MKFKYRLILWVLILLLPVSGLAEGSVSRLYSFSAGEILDGDSMEEIRELLEEVRLELTSDPQESFARGQAVLLSYGKPVFTLRAEASRADDAFGLYCSLLGDCTLKCRQDQVQDFLMSFVDMLGDLSVLQQDSLDSLRPLALRAGTLIQATLESSDYSVSPAGIDPGAYLERINALASSSEILSCELDGTDPECPGAVKKQIWRLSEEDRTAFLDFTLSSLARIPFLSDALQNEKIRIGTQPLTEPFLRNLFSSLRGETTLTYYTDPLNQILLMQLSFPDLSSLVEDPEFRRIRGLEFRVNRSGSEEEKNLTSLTTILLPGLEGTLLSARMEMSPGSPIQPLPGNKVYEVGGLDSSGLRKLFASLSFAIAGNAVNLIMDLPPLVFHTLLGRFF